MSLEKYRKREKMTSIALFLSIALIIIGIILLVTNSQSFKRGMVDLKSEYGGGLERTINVYTANGDLLASYHGKIDIDANDGGYVKFDYDGKRYMYYNCFVESIADIK